MARTEDPLFELFMWLGAAIAVIGGAMYLKSQGAVSFPPPLGSSASFGAKPCGCMGGH